MTWLFGKPTPGEWLVVDAIYRQRSVAIYRHDLGWCIRGRWLGHDAVECFQALEPVPDRGTTRCATSVDMTANAQPTESYARYGASAAGTRRR